MLKIKGINEPPQEEDGFRILLDEFWPEGLSKEDAKVDLWLKEITTTEYHDKWPENDSLFEEIEAKDRDELRQKKTIIKIIRDNEKEKGTVTFLCSTIKSITQLEF